jgi:hypothetical protein
MRRKLEARRERILREVGAGLGEARAIKAEADVTSAEAAATIRVLERTQVALQRITSDPGEFNIEHSRRIAGPAAIMAVEEVLERVGRTTQAEITHATERNSGTITHALRVLEAVGTVRRSGRRHRGSDEWVWTAIEGDGLVKHAAEGDLDLAAIS